MRVSTRLLLVLLAVVAAGVGFTGPSEAVNLPAFTWIVPCDDPDGVATNEFVPDVFMVGGTYLVTTAGVCTIDDNFYFTGSTGTPCGTSTTGPLPCATVNLQNLPGPLCWESLLYATVGLCAGPYGEPAGPGAHLNNCSTSYGVAVNATCLPLGGAGIITQATAGPMRAKFIDVAYADNGGYFVVTATLTPL